jgi:hypothetical protein
MNISAMLTKLVNNSCPKKLTWEYRVIHHDDGSYHIREVYYRGDEPMSWAEPAACPYDYYDKWEDLRDDLQAMLSAFSRPMLTVVDGEILRSCEPKGDD